MTLRRAALAVAAWILGASAAPADWPTVRGDAARSGASPAEVRPPFRLAWVKHFTGERVGSAAEPIVAGGKVYVATHGGSLYALDSETGKPLWRFRAGGPFLHSPAVHEGVVIAGSADGQLHGIDAATGEPRWAAFAHGGFSASPTAAEGAAFLGSRGGEFLAVEVKTGKERWRVALPAPVRETAAYHDGRVYVTAEDLRARCLDAATGKVMWTSEQLAGQSARDGHPVIHRAGGKTYVLVRTNPVINMATLIARDRRLLCANAGVDDSDWKKLDAWTKGAEALGDARAWERERNAVAQHLRRHPELRTLFILDAATGKQAGVAPVLWVGGCQGLCPAPAALPEGRVQVMYRSAYGNWNHGVAPLVALGALDLAALTVDPWRHRHGKQPPWNTFWGTADESQAFVAAAGRVLIVHQSTLSLFDPKAGGLEKVWGERDSWGGFRNLPWARNEWNGPARGGVAISGKRIWWQTGSRVLCLVAGEQGKPAADEAIDGASVPTRHGPAAPRPDEKELRRRLLAAAAEVLSTHWAPLCVEPGLAGREHVFSHSAETLTALALAYPHLPPKMKQEARVYLAWEWLALPPHGKVWWYRTDAGVRRERFALPDDVTGRPEKPRLHHALGNCHATWLYAERCGEWKRVLRAWPEIRAAFEDFVKSGWKLDAARGDPHANRYLGGLLALAKVARKAGDENTARRADKLADDTAAALAAWWERSAAGAGLRVIPSIREWDEFIGKGDALFLRVAAHKHRVALFDGLTPEAAALVKAKAPAAVEKVWRTVEALCPTWHLQGEERQVHSGENNIDPPGFALGAFQALAWLRGAPAGELARRVDVPFCRADLYHLVKLVLALERRLADGPEKERPE